MDPQIYYDLAVDSAFTALIFPVRGEFLLNAMLSYGGYDVMRSFLYSTSGSLIGFMGSYIIGFALIMIGFLTGFFKQADKLRFAKANFYVGRYGTWLAIFAGFGVLGSFIPFILGIYRANPFLMLSLAGIGKLAYYAIFYFSWGLAVA